jgi:hypothetical protein
MTKAAAAKSATESLANIFIETLLDRVDCDVMNDARQARPPVDAYPESLGLTAG